MTPSAAALDYARQVVRGKIEAGRYVKLACQRFLDDLERTDWEFKFDYDRADAAVEFQEAMPHTKGQWAAQGKRLEYEPWQHFIECNIFGWVHKDTGARRFSESYEEVARKNGKSIRLAARALYMFCADGAFGSECYTGASTERQAWEVFRPARQMVQRTPELRDSFDIEVNAKTLAIPANGSRFEPLIGKPGDGQAPFFYCADEYHQHPDADQYEAMVTGMGSRFGDGGGPLASVITTAGVNLGGACYEKRGDVIKVLEGTVTDERLFGIIFCADDDDEWTSDAALQKANPNLGVSVSEDFLRGQRDKARRSASLQNAFKTKHLNLWCGAAVAWMNMLAWQRQKRPDLKLEDYAGRRAWIGVDLASKKDVAAVAVLIPDGAGFQTFYDFFVPEGALEHNHKYRHFAEWMTVTPGAATDYAFIEDRLAELCRVLDVVEISFDQWQAQMLMQRLMARGMRVVEYAHTVKNFSDPMKEVEALVLDGRLFHNNPVQDWMMSNVTAHLDVKENIYPRKQKDEKLKIDGVVALIMCMGRYLASDDMGGFDDFLSNPVTI